MIVCFVRRVVVMCVAGRVRSVGRMRRIGVRMAIVWVIGRIFRAVLLALMVV